MSRKPKVRAPALNVCFRPKKAWLAPPDVDGKRKAIFRLPAGVERSPLELAKYDAVQFDCRKCISCRLRKSYDWAFRCVVEAREHEFNSWITLTYDPEHYPVHGSLVPDDLRLFWKRCRKAGIKLRYFACGEYGEQGLRPHYHACVFGHAFADRVPFGVTTRGKPQFVSAELTRLWGKGLATVSDFSYELAAYTARYTLKKITGPLLEKPDPVTGLCPYERVTEFGEIVQVEPEFVRMSLKPGIGAKWFERHGSEVFPKGTVVVKGRERPAPEYFWKLLERDDPEYYRAIKAERAEHARLAADDPDRSQRRLDDREANAESYFSRTRKRSLVQPRSIRGDVLSAVRSRKVGSNG